ncbi:unnamed protein product, partial [Pocillopora meandrina]
MAVSKVFTTFRGDILHKDCKATATPWNIRTRTGTRFCKMFDELNYRNVPAFILLRQIRMKHSSTQELHVLLLKD